MVYLINLSLRFDGKATTTLANLKTFVIDVGEGRLKRLVLFSPSKLLVLILFAFFLCFECLSKYWIPSISA